MIPLLAVVALLAVLASPGPATADGYTVRPVVAAGQAAPGGGSFQQFTVESLPIVAPINGRGDVAFFATLLRGSGGEGLFLASKRGIARIAVEGDPTPGGGAIAGLGKHPIPALNESGAVAFAAGIAGGKAVEGIFTASGGRLQPVALAPAAAPGIASGTLAALESPALNDRGDVAFIATVRRGRETGDVIYVRTRGKLQKLVAQGDPAPQGGLFAGFGAPVINNDGAVAFAAVVEGRGVPGGIFVAHAGRIKMLVGAGDETPVGGIFMRFSERVAVNDRGLVVFHSVVKNGPVAAAVFAAQDERVRKVAATGDAAPGGGTLSHFGPWPTVNAAGAVAFVASVDGGPSPVGAFVAAPSGLSRIAAVGETLPGGGLLATFTLYPVVSLGSNGGVTFTAAPTATGEGVAGIYLATPSR